MNILEKTIKLLNERKGDWVSIAKDANVSYSWITKFANNKIPNPGIKTIEALFSILKSKG